MEEVSSSQYETTTSDYERRKDQKIVILTVRICEKGMTGKDGLFCMGRAESSLSCCVPTAQFLFSLSSGFLKNQLF